MFPCNKKAYGWVPLQLGLELWATAERKHREDFSLSAKVSKRRKQEECKTRNHSKPIPQRWHSDLLRDGVLPNPSVSQISMNHPLWITRAHTLRTHRIVKRKELHNGLRLDNFARVGLQSRRVRHLNSYKFWIVLDPDSTVLVTRDVKYFRAWSPCRLWWSLCQPSFASRNEEFEASHITIITTSPSSRFCAGPSGHQKSSWWSFCICPGNGSGESVSRLGSSEGVEPPIHKLADVKKRMITPLAKHDRTRRWNYLTPNQLQP